MSPAQKAILDFIVSYRIAHDSISPSYAEIAEATGNRSKANVSHLIDRLVERGYLRREARGSRSLIPVESVSDFQRGRALGRLEGYDIALASLGPPAKAQAAGHALVPLDARPVQ